MNSEEKHIHYFASTIGWNLCCKQATYLTLKKEEMQKLALKEEIALKFHLAICKFCRAFKKQSQFLNEIIGQSIKNASFEMPEAEKDKLNTLINNNL